MSSGIPIVLGPEISRRVAEALAAVPGVAEVRIPPAGDVAGALGDAGVLITYLWSDDWLTGDLAWIQSYTAGVDQFPADRIAAAGVVLTSAVGIHEVQVSEHAFGLLLGLTRGIGEAARNQQSHRWSWPKVIDLAGMTMGVLGLGAIGEAVARKATAFGMFVVGTKRSPEEYSGVADEVFAPQDTLEVFRRSDVVVVTLPDTPETRRIVGAEELAALDGGYLINVGRGAVIDQDALVAALRSGEVRGAGLDVFEEEPLPETSPLWELPGVLITPHVAGASPHYGDRLAALFARNLEAYQAGVGWINRVV